MSKKNIILLFFLVLSLIYCDIYKAFKENKVIIEFLNNQFSSWNKKEDEIINKYNTIIVGENFTSENLWLELNKNILPKALELRENINFYQSNNKEIIEVKKIYLEKIDIMIEGLDLIKRGFEKKDNPDFNLIYRGRDKISVVNSYNKIINEKIQKIIKDYYIKSDQIKKEIINKKT